MKKLSIGDKRLLKLAKHLETKPGLDRFNFTTTCTVIHNEHMFRGRHGCGTVGCAMGEMPKVWPKSFVYRCIGKVFRHDELPRTAHQITKLSAVGELSFGIVRAKHLEETQSVAVRDWFDLTIEAFGDLFYHGIVESASTGITRLGSTATATEVASNIRKFVAYRNRRKNDYVSQAR